jgi:hypothetical protein
MATTINGSTGASQIQDDTVTTAKVNDSQITNALMADDAIGVAELSATGTASSSTFLRGDNAWAAPAGGGVTYLGTMTTTSGTEQEIASLDLTDVNILLFVYNQVSHTDGSSQRLTLGIGGNTLYGWGNTISAAQGLSGMLQIDLRNNIGAWVMSQQSPITSGNQWASSYAGHIIYTIGTNLRASSSTTVKVGMSGATFDNGSVNVYGLK